MPTILTRIFAQEDINFLLTNRLPRRLATRLFGRFSKIENPLLARTSIALWKRTSDLDLSDAATSEFRSLHECFTRALRPGSRPPDPRPDVLVAPCDAIIGARGRINGESIYQVKGFPYTLSDLIDGVGAIDDFRDGTFVTLRLTASMYHRFHAPHDLSVTDVTYISGDSWNVNPVALKRVQKLFCKNERAVIRCRLDSSGLPILLVPVAAILVASIRLHFCDTERSLRTIAASEKEFGHNHHIPCNARLSKGQEMGWFEHGSTILLFAPRGFALMDAAQAGTRIRAGQPLMKLPNTVSSH